MNTPVLRVVLQRYGSDCSVAALAMLCCTTYEEALLAMGLNEPRVLTGGAYMKQIEVAANAFGVHLTRKQKFNVEEDHGIMYVSNHTWPHGHVAVLWNGYIVDTDGTIWEPDVYQSVHAAKFGPLLVRT